ncbi:hypothetical protein Sjap_015409 [Stephania japonica]|uniref:Uncharacterized protein n=1 Tax=Stephania japonica TaxID=461633 RepID=A0AAP0IKZ5_9MAGN
MELWGEHSGVLFREVPICSVEAGGLGKLDACDMYCGAARGAQDYVQGIKGVFGGFAKGVSAAVDCGAIVEPPIYVEQLWVES